MSTVSKLSVIILGLFFSFTTQAESHSQQKVYKYVDTKGRVSFAERPAHDGYVKMQLTRQGWVDPTQTFNYRENKKKYEELIATASQEYHVPAWLISAVIHAESLYDPQAVSRAGAVGLVPLMPGTARRYGVSNRQDPSQNIDGGVRYLRDLIDMFEGNFDLAVAAYNAGENAVIKYGNRIPPYKETQHYVQRVGVLSRKYKSRTI